MSMSIWRVVGGAISIVISAAVGLTTNVITSRWSWAWGTALVVLLLSAVGIQVALSLTDKDGPAGRPNGPESARKPTGQVTAGRDAIVGSRNTVGVSGRYLVLVLVVVGVLVLGVVVLIAPGRGESDTSAPGPSATAPGDPLRLTLTGLDNTCHSVMLPESVADKAARFVSVTRQPTDPDAFMRDELAVGGYAWGSLIVRLNTQSPLAQQVTITDVKVVDLEPAEPVHGALVDLHTCGGDEVNAMVIHINAPDMRPFATDDESHETDQHFFDSQVVNVSPGKKQSFMIRLVVDPDRTAGAYTFRLALTYEFDSKIRTAVVDDGGRPFRLTGGCDFSSATSSAGQQNELMRPVDAKEWAAVLCGG